MIKRYCDICGRQLNLSYNKDRDDYRYGEIDIDFGEWFRLDDVCKRCADKYYKITKDETMEFIRKKCCVECDES